ncbi:MAG: indolepyruvate oxidoreductase subunit B, partial [Rhodospirillaceae bacterium]|nr:indolepyruvate oxidoreductase subunit B [Rhodospirillaceae bacterium]
ARAHGYDCQATSMAGVAQRTGSTIYYIEMAPAGGSTPVFALAPAAGDVDILIAAEMMEVGRAILRGFVTPDRTTLIGSTHRALAVSEKIVPGNGIASTEEVYAAAEMAAARLFFLDMEKLARDSDSVISASLLGALAGSGSLPFPKHAYSEAITKSRRGVENSLRAFSAAYDLLTQKKVPEAPTSEFLPTISSVAAPAHLLAAWEGLVARADSFPGPVVGIARLGLRKVVDFQNTEYGSEYLDFLERVINHDFPEQNWELAKEAAKHIANAMAYDDVIRVADLKTRRQRFKRIRTEMKVSDNELMHLTEFMHPRAEEIVGMFPIKLGERIANDPRWMTRLDRWFNRSRRLRTDTFRGFLTLYFIGGLRRWRLKTYRHAMEQEHLNAWLEKALVQVDRSYALSLEIIRCRRLIKGYSDTHSRSQSKFERVMGGVDLVAGRKDAADWVRRLRDAALADETGEELDGAIRTIRGFI